MTRCSKTQQSSETKKIIAAAKNMVRNGHGSKEVFNYIENCYNEMAKATGLFDNIQYRKALKAVIEFM